MKQTLHFTTLLLLITVASFSQNKKLKTRHIINPCNNEEVTYSYDKKGLLTEEVSKMKAFNGHMVVNRTLYKYDKDKVAAVQYICNDTLVSEELSEYIGNDLVHYRKTVKGKLQVDEAYTYKKGQVLSVISTTPSGIAVQKMKYDNAHKTKETSTSVGATVTVLEKEFTEGNMKRVEQYTPPFTGEPQSVKIYVYDYDGNVIDDRTMIKGQETSRIVSRFENNIPASKKEFAYGEPIFEMLYDEYGNPLREQKFDTKEIFIYDSKFTPSHHLKEVKILKDDKVQCIKTYENEYWD
ncbi:hypothetical protein [Flavobacterium psychrotrophum]|uniref:hypothetical protein n=1 Tax=Flavobacterium psychrotrophum TaxID=2294119 RepID=UPI000E3116E0|nr:hypothetical protein [Flavobacterium psychrotrophum]